MVKSDSSHKIFCKPKGKPASSFLIFLTTRKWLSFSLLFFYFLLCGGRLGSQHVIFPFAFGILAPSIKMAKIDGVSHGTCVRTPAAAAQTDSNAVAVSIRAL